MGTGVNGIGVNGMDNTLLCFHNVQLLMVDLAGFLLFLWQSLAIRSSVPDSVLASTDTLQQETEFILNLTIIMHVELQDLAFQFGQPSDRF